MNHSTIIRNILASLLVIVVQCTMAQDAVQVGNGSYASYPPLSKGKTSAHSGDNSTYMLTKKLWLNESTTEPDGSRRPIPTNDWWTDLLNEQFADALWAYPQMVHPSASGVTINYPSYWNDNGTEVKWNSSIQVQGVDFTATSAIADNWHDWDVEMLLPGTTAGQQMYVTMAHGQPFTWIETKNLTLKLVFSSTPEFFDALGNTVSTSSISSISSNDIAVKIGDDVYGVFLPKSVSFKYSDNSLFITFSGSTSQFVSIGMMKSATDLADFAKYAYSVPRSTTLSWNHDEQSAMVTSHWQVNAENLLNSSSDAPVLQGFLPHAYKNSTLGFGLNGITYLTPRGTMKIAEPASSNTWDVSYSFSGMLPYYPAPAENEAAKNPFSLSLMTKLMTDYAAKGSFGDDTYWGGKGLTQMALNMTFARELGDNATFQKCRDKLKAKLINWLTYTPGETRDFFAYYPRWGSLVGFDTSYDSDKFNDHHFHYGYFVYAGALLCLMDDDFKAGYGEMLKLVAKDYANWDHTDYRFPFLRTLDVWAGHSYAGGLGDGANSNGNGQESSSESMQSWGGLYLLGVALGDKDMRNAGIFGWNTESRATAEYWFDRDHIHEGLDHNYDYTKYSSPYCSNLTSKGIGWWTWFSGDPLWMHSIQWMPVSPCLNYLSQDLDFVKWDYGKMMSASGHQWFDAVGDTTALADASVGNVVLCYMERWNPDSAAAVFDKAYALNRTIAKDADTGHISYYVIHSHRTYGDIDFSIHADVPTATAYRKLDSDGVTYKYTYVVYNPNASERLVHFSKDGATVASFKAPARTMTAYSDSPVASSVKISSVAGNVVPQSGSSVIKAAVLDQYGASVDGAAVTLSVSDAAVATVADSVFTVAATAHKGDTCVVTATYGSVSSKLKITVNDVPVLASAAISPVVRYVEKGQPVTFTLPMTDQFGNDFHAPVQWTITRDGKAVATDSVLSVDEVGIYTVTAASQGKKFSQEVYVTPSLRNVAEGKTAVSSSEENAGTATANAVYGVAGSRWGSQHTDDQWIYVDLGENTYISRVKFLWETAHAASYILQIAPDSAATEDFTGSYITGTKTVKVVADSAWTTVGTVTDCAGGTDNQTVNATGRYIRMRGLTRATDYGYSLYEFQVYGIPSSFSADSIIGIDLSSPASKMKEGEKLQLTAKAYTLAGNSVSKAMAWTSTDAAGSVDDGLFCPSTYGDFTVTATSADGYSVSCDIAVEETLKLASMDVSPDSAQLILGDTLAYTVEGSNQFGGVYNLQQGVVNVDIYDSSDALVNDGRAAFDANTFDFSATSAGNYLLRFSADTVKAFSKVKALKLEDVNLALFKPASSTSSEGDGTAAKYVNDGNEKTRWASGWTDGESVTIDLQSAYLLRRMEFQWESAYASKYHIETSLDGVAWTTAFTRTDGVGGLESCTLANVPARYVKLVCDYRFMRGYGSSIYEWRVYGSARYSGVVTGTIGIISGSNGVVDVYSVEGRLLRKGVASSNAVVGLDPGIYIVGNRKVIVSQ
jgi:endoglucanase Acf2